MLPFPNGEQERPELGSELLAQVSETVSVLKKARTGLAGLEPYIDTLQNAKALAQRGTDMVEQEGFQDLVRSFQSLSIVLCISH